MPYLPPHLRNQNTDSDGFTTVAAPSFSRGAPSSAAPAPGAYVPPALRRGGPPGAAPSSYATSLSTPQEPEHKPKTVIAGTDTIDTYEIAQKEGPLSMAEKLALATSNAAQVKNVKARAKPTKRQVQLSKEKENAISDQAFYDEQMADRARELREVVMDGAVLTQIVNHAQSEKYEAVKGQLLGCTRDGVLKISSSFPLLEDADKSYAQVKAESQMENKYTFDNVGWYLSSLMESYLNMSTIEIQYQYQRISGNQCVFLVYDATKSETKGVLNLHAYRLSAKFMDLVREITQNQNQEKKTVSKTQHEEELKTQIELQVKYSGLPDRLPLQHLDMETIVNKGMSASDIFTEVPVRIENNLLLETFLHELDEELSLDEPFGTAQDVFDLGIRPKIERRLGSLYVAHDDLHQSQERYLAYLKASAQLKRDGHLPKQLQKIMKRQPNPLDMLLNRDRIQHHCEALLEESAEGVEKLELLEAIEQVRGQ